MMGDGMRISTDSIDIPILVISADGSIRDANAAFLRLAELKRGEALSLNVRDMSLFRTLARRIDAAISKGSPYTHKHKIGERYFDVCISPVTSDGYALIYLYDLSPFFMLEQDLIKRNRELMIMNTLSSAFISSDNIEGVFSDLLDKILLVTDFSVGFIMLRGNTGFELKSHAGISREFQIALSAGDVSSLLGSVERTEDPIYIYELDDLRDLPSFGREGICFLIAAPFRAGGILRGVTFLASRAERKLDFDHASILSLIGHQLSLIVEKIDLFEETQRLSVTDSLTGLFNSRYFYRELEKELARSVRYHSHFSLAILDVDDFKKINDTYGHECGDEVLIEVASMLKSASRATDVVARYGGEEFVIIFPNTGKSEAHYVCLRILQHINEGMIETTQGPAVQVTVSGGIATFPEDGVTTRELLIASDRAMYQAKAEGKKRVVCYNTLK